MRLSKLKVGQEAKVIKLNIRKKLSFMVLMKIMIS